MTIETPEFLTEKEAAVLLGLSAHTMRNWRGAGVGPAYLKLGSAVRYARATVTSWALDQEVAA
ncbi:helix-turn-helix transcriptional regulator [Conyzicola sp.]|uniref:helix-turn-helix transcriptional regulator n=1 Tax=Conyzicola sp. TaxID=1969404 RepID=UPI003989FF68